MSMSETQKREMRQEHKCSHNKPSNINYRSEWDWHRSHNVTLVLILDIYSTKRVNLGFPGGSDSKASTCNAGDLGSIPGSGKSPGEGNGSPLQYYCPWKISWTEEPWRLQSMGSQRVRHN